MTTQSSAGNRLRAVPDIVREHGPDAGDMTIRDLYRIAEILDLEDTSLGEAGTPGRGAFPVTVYYD